MRTNQLNDGGQQKITIKNDINKNTINTNQSRVERKAPHNSCLQSGKLLVFMLNVCNNSSMAHTAAEVCSRSVYYRASQHLDE